MHPESKHDSKPELQQMPRKSMSLFPKALVPSLLLPLIVLALSASGTQLSAAPISAAPFSTTLLSAAPQSKGFDDKISLRSGKLLRRIQVVEEGLDKVKYKKGSKESTIEAREVLDVEWSQAPDSFVRAELAAEKADWAVAANLYQEASSGADRPALAASVGYRAIECLLRAARKDPSQAKIGVQAAQSWTSAQGNHRLITSALEMQGTLQILAGDAKGAQASFGKLEDLAKGKDLPTTWIGRAKFGQGRALLLAKDYKKARQAYQAAAATLKGMDLSEDPTAAALLVSAQVGEGETLIEEKKFAQAERSFSGLAMSAGDNGALKIAATCGKAAAVAEQGIQDKDSKKLRQAQTELAKVSVGDIWDGDASPKALYYLGRVLEALGKREPAGPRKARIYYKTVAELYPDSRWAALAEAKLK